MFCWGTQWLCRLRPLQKMTFALHMIGMLFVENMVVLKVLLTAQTIGANLHANHGTLVVHVAAIVAHSRKCRPYLLGRFTIQLYQGCCFWILTRPAVLAVMWPLCLPVNRKLLPLAIYLPKSALLSDELHDKALLDSLPSTGRSNPRRKCETTLGPARIRTRNVEVFGMCCL